MRHLEDFKPGEVIELGSFPVEEVEMLEFARRYDPQPFHTDLEEGRRSTWGGVIASGWLTASLLSRGLATRILNQAASLGPEGTDELRWLKPVYPGDVLTATYEVLEMDAEAGTVLGLGTVRNQKGEEVMTLRARHRIAGRSEG